VQYTNSILRNQAATHRKRIFTSAGVPNFTELSDARITALRPLQVDDYGIIVIPTGVMVGRGKYLIIFKKFNTYSNILAVIALYSKTGGKNGKHSSVSESSNISAISFRPFKFSNTCMLGNSARYQLPPQSFKLTSFSYFRQSIFLHSSTTT